MSLPTTEAEWAATPRSMLLAPDAEDMKLASTHTLKPCPFCGSRGAMAHGKTNKQTGIYSYMVECNQRSCMASTFANGMSRDEARREAIRRWESRA